MITAATLKRFAPMCSTPQIHAAALEAARVKSQVNTPARLACLMGQIAHETAGLTLMVESMNWRDPERLDKFYSAVRGIDDAKALIARGQAAIANRVYGGRLGNGDEASGDGWRFRGSGYLQLTGRANYVEIGKLLGLDLVGHPEWVRDPASAARVALQYWDARGCNELADVGDVGGVTRLINGPALAGIADRLSATARAREVWRAT
ncbi:glycoside hydrolase family 19 protein [Roseateles sp. DXS20W]|uniref:Glycoside hydrolase family 19 protein n=1 Tax=Pelomonas lactea TaxID=3299030 RepID=A0ABW7GK24_9BURK